MNLITEKARQALLHRRESLRALLQDGSLSDGAFRAGWRGAGHAQAAQVMQPGLSEQELRELTEIDAALVRIDCGHFGRC
jgi:RNA polymerase-binding transcription factor DksA